MIGGLSSTLMCACTLVLLMFLDVGIEEVKNSRPAFDPHEAEDDEYIDVLEQQGENILELLKKHIDLVKIVMYVFLSLSLLLIVTSSMLIHGVRRNRQGLLLPFITQLAIMLVVYIALIILLFVIFGKEMAIISFVLSIVANLVFDLYFLLVSISQYQALGLIRMHEEISMK